MKLKKLTECDKIERNAVYKTDYPVFSFKYFDSSTIKNSKDSKFFVNFLSRLQKLSELGWNGIRQSKRHEFGMEKIPVKQIKKQLPKIITPEIHSVHVFRASGDNRVFVGLQEENIFHIFFLECEFGQLYEHS